MNSRWSVIPWQRYSAAYNMAADEALLEFATTSATPVLRFYGWTEPAATFGYFQKYAEVEGWTKLRPLIRRPTGGGLVPHDADWTYSLAFPPGHEWFELKAVESYERCHNWVREAFQRCRVETNLAPTAIRSAAGQCFIGAEMNDVLWEGKKIAGAAQRRNKLGLLIQGSVQAQPPGVKMEDWHKAVLAAGVELFGAEWEDFVPHSGFEARVTHLEVERYRDKQFNQKR